MFQSNALPVISVFNKTMQMQAPTIHILHHEVQSFMKKILLRFLSPRTVQASSVYTTDLRMLPRFYPWQKCLLGRKQEDI